MSYPTPQDPYQPEPYQPPQSSVPYSPGPYPPAYQPPQAYQAPPGYQAQPAYGAPYLQPIVVTRPASGAATASLVFGILGILGGWCLIGIPCVLAVIFGHVGLAQTGDGTRSGRGQAVAGLIMGYLFVVPALLIFFFAVLGAITGVGDQTTTPTP